MRCIFYYWYYKLLAGPDSTTYKRISRPITSRTELAQAQSASSSVNQLLSCVNIDSGENEGNQTRMAEVTVSKPPKKKKKPTSERTLLTHQGEKKRDDVRNHGGRWQTLVTMNDKRACPFGWRLWGG